ncbi:T9SS C-terminal target domain-containing protein [candidate division KSB1 bacterium]|nr:MAG: T9SS C-terminal target domain-containing protein [candidate division KSB1 bacterium]MBC6947130.1 T9SS C-terminal target domain-containing protein [candidate division KSB1 bacterium]MCE7944777.1 T9SS C-terminal target domain-containing protein [Chlorobi bacterium CHB1]
MKTERLVLVVLLFLFETAIAQNGWFWQYPKPQGNTLRDIFIFDSNTAIAVGDVGTVIKTTDGGMHWEVQHHAGGTSYDLCSVHFVDVLHGWAAGGTREWFKNKNVLIKTIDGGKTWTEVETGIDSLNFNAVHFVNADTGFVVGEDGILLRTTNGGNSWDRRKMDDYIGFWLDIFQLTAVTFTDEHTGWIIGAGYYGNQIYKTTDCGATWQWNEWIINPKIYNGLWDICFVDKKNGFIIGDNSDFLKTTDGGITWQHQILSEKYQTDDYQFFNSVFFTDSMTGWIVGGNGTIDGRHGGFILKTIDGGENWVKQDSTKDFGQFYIVRFSSLIAGEPTKKEGWIMGQDGIIYRTIDSGDNWISQGDEKYGLNSIYFIDESTGWAVGEKGVVLHTEDGGSNWHEQSQSDTLLLSSVYAIDTQTAFVVGEKTEGSWPSYLQHGIILRTTDGGQSWTRQTFDTLSKFSSIVFVNDSTGWITVTRGTLLKTTDKGNTWKQFSSGLGTVLNSIQFIDDSTGWVSFYGGNTLLKTLDGGENWNSQFIDSNLRMYSFHFATASMGWAVGEYSGRKNIFKTLDGGASWSPSINAPIAHYYFVHFVNENTGWAVGGYRIEGRLKSSIIKTIDGGGIWIEQKGPTMNEIFSIYFINENTGWAVGDGIFKTTTGGVVSVDEKEESGNNVPRQIMLFQNYPNPFNSSTIFHYKLPKSDFVSLRVYDLLGRLVNTLVEKWLPEGDYKISWSANNLPSGLYFFRLRVGEFSETKKAILLR